MKIRDLMTVNPAVISLEQTVADVARLFLENEIDGAPVLNEKGELVGLITKTHLMEVIARGLPADTPARTLMTTEVETVDPDDNVWEFQKRRRGRLPVTIDDKLVGMFTRSDLMTAFFAMMEKTGKELEATIDCMYNPVVSIDTSGNIQVFNKAAEKLLGLRADEVRGRNIKDLVYNTKLIEVMETGQTQSTQKIVIGDKTFLSNRTPVVKEGRIVGAVAVLQEISELEEVSKELAYTKRLNQELDAIIESSFDGLYVTDGEGNTLRVNKATERITGVPTGEVIGRNMRELVEEGVYSRSGTLLALEKQERVTTTLETRTGQTVLVTSNPIYDDEGNIFRVVTNVRDVTELNELKQKLEQISQLYQTELQQLRLQNSQRLVVNSPKMKELLNLVTRLAGVDSTVLIQGESGVGKELIAEIIHTHSSRKDGPLIKINCGAIPENLLESELFGYEPGAFTGASKQGKAGLFELANGGTLFLDEVGEMPLNLQVKLLRVLQDRKITRVGGIKSHKVNVRVLAGTNRNLVDMIGKKQFREDLYYRLNVVPVHVPPLRERKEDILPLVQHFLQGFNKKYRMTKRMAADAIERLIEYDWPGNVRELENLIERLVVITVGDVITSDDLPAWAQGNLQGANPESEIIPLRRAVENAERKLLQKAFARYDSTYQVARVLGVNQSTVFRKAVKYGLKQRERTT